MNKCICGNVLHIDVGDSIRSGIYRWHVSYHCDKCGVNTEMDGRDIESIPDDIQILIIKRDGKWGLISLASKVRVNYLFNKIFQSKNRNFVEGFCFVGTLNQVKWVKDKLIEKGIAESELQYQRL